MIDANKVLKALEAAYRELVTVRLEFAFEEGDKWNDVVYAQNEILELMKKVKEQENRDEH